ncbi:Positive regulator of CheA protein activity [Sandaracinus amylolyticus]|uniref:Positive regulator of CheA protein activity n=1 Tax=Sandaracinus amylolyticus TaxID=927083 RepID=A0A0F6W6E3_9BACT|nr:Positive regulator of CheA protein activity [Sandaracinus amylolyticus]
MSVAREVRRRGSDRDKNLVGFLIGDVHYAIDIQRVKEIIRPLPLVSLPHPPPAVVGVADHRGEVVPVLDVRRRFGLPASTESRRTKWLLVTLPGRTVGLIVDAVSEVFAAGEEDQRAVPAIGMGDQARGIVAVFGHRGTLVFVLDVDRIGAAAELVDVEAAFEMRGRA